MKRIGRETWLIIGLFSALVLVTIAAAIQQSRAQGETEDPPFSSLSSRPNGTRALWLWLNELGYEVSNEVGTAFLLAEHIDVLLMMEPVERVTADEWRTIDNWVEDGGTLILAGDQWGTARAVRHYDFGMHYAANTAFTLTAQTPLLLTPPLTTSVNARAWAYLETDRDDFVTHLAIGSQPVLLSFQHGSGRVFLCAAPYPFSNAGLKEEGNPGLVLNIIAAVKRPGMIWFDEWHHGVRGAAREVIGPEDWLRFTPAGRSLLFVAAVIFFALVWRGRSFGRPVPLRRQVVRRAPLEYVTAVAQLNRRAGHRQAVLQHYHQSLKRTLGRRYRLNPTLPDDEYVAHLSTLNPNLDAPALSGLLARLRRPEVSEMEMVQLAAEVAQWLKES